MGRKRCTAIVLITYGNKEILNLDTWWYDGAPLMLKELLT